MRVSDTLKERGNRYGNFENVAFITEELMWALSQAPNFGDLSPTHRQAFHMIFSKIARCACGDPTYIDNIHDIAGYATLLENYLKKEKEDENK